MANSLKSQLFEFICKKGRKRYSPQCTYINYTLKRCIKNNVRLLFHAKVYLSEKLNYRDVFGLHVSVLRYLNL